MTVALCVDDSFGLQFNRRRQSRDSAVVADLLTLAGGRLFLHPDTLPLIPEGAKAVKSPRKVPKDGVYFYEGFGDLPDFEKVSSVVLYRWNRAYPQDLAFDPSLLSSFTRTSSEELVGTSHESITKEIYQK